MTDVEPLILDSLHRLVPAPGTAGVDWRDVELRAGQPRRQRRGLFVAVAFAAVLLIAGVALAATGRLPWWESAAPAVHKQIVTANLRGARRDITQLARRDHLGSINVARARTVATSGKFALVAAPAGHGGFCLIAFIPNPTVGTFCSYGSPKPQRDQFWDYRRTSFDGGALWILYGKIANANAAVLDLSEAAGVSFKIPLGPGGFFLARVPRSRWAALSEKTGPGRLLNASGSAIGNGCISWGPSPRAIAPFLRQRPPKGIVGPSPNSGDENLGLWVEGTSTCKPQVPTRAPTLELKTARKTVSMTLLAGESIWKPGQQVALWHVEKSDGTSCYLLSEATHKPRPYEGNCTPRPPARAFRNEHPHGPLLQGPFQVSTSGSRYHGTWDTLLIGFVSPYLKHVASLQLSTPAGTKSVAYNSGVFMVQIVGGSPFQLPGHGPYVLTAYNASGRIIARHALHLP